MNAFGAAIDAWRSYGSAPEIGSSTNPKLRSDRFMLLQSLYAGVGYQGDVGRDYRSAHDLYDSTRQIINPVKALCDFYAVHVYSGPLSPDGEREVEGEDAALPLVTLIGGTDDASEQLDALERNVQKPSVPASRSSSTLSAPGQPTRPAVGAPPVPAAPLILPPSPADLAEKALRAAFGQLSHGWWAWDTYLNHRVRQTEILGNLLTEIIDEPESGKVRLDYIWPGFVTEMTLDSAGNVQGYVLEYEVYDPGDRNPRTGRREGGTTYNWRKVVTPDSYSYYKNDSLDREEENPYGFVPAVWDRCRLGWSAWGEPAIFGSQGAMDEINELLSHADDRMHQMFSTPIVIAGGGGSQTLTFAASDRNQVNTVSVPGAGGLSTITFNLGEITAAIEKIQDAVATECPEVRVYQDIRGMTALTGPGMNRAVADVGHRLNERAAGYDRQTIKLLQMATAISGWRISNGDWGSKAQMTSEQLKFADFDLDSYKAGDLDCMMLPRQLFKETPDEKIAALVQIGQLSDPWLLAQAGVPENEIARMLQEREAARAEMAANFGIADAGGPGNGGRGQGPSQEPPARDTETAVSAPSA